MLSDFTDNCTTFVVLFLIECGLGIIAASLSTLRPLRNSAMAGILFAISEWQSRLRQSRHFPLLPGYNASNQSWEGWPREHQPDEECGKIESANKLKNISHVRTY
jgi:hypothetical protein